MDEEKNEDLMQSPETSSKINNSFPTWKINNHGECVLRFFHRDGRTFNGSMEDFFAEHVYVTGLQNILTGRRILINHFGEACACSLEQETGK